MQDKYPPSFHHKHSPDEIRKRLESQTEHSYLRDTVYGAIDGTVTTFAIVSGVVGANLESSTIIILGFANLIADGFSMAASNYVGTKTETEERLLIEQFEHDQIKVNPKGEKEEVRQILKSKGFTGDLLEQATDVFVQDKKRWVDLMIKEEYGLAIENRSPMKAGLVTFAAFSIFGLIPLLPFVTNLPGSFLTSCLMTVLAFFLIGSLKSRWTSESYWLSGLKTLGIGSGAAVLAYGIGFLLKGLA